MATPSSSKPSTSILDNAQRLQDTLAKAELNIVDAQQQFDSRTTTTDETIRLPLTFGDSGGLVDPASISLDLTAQLVRRPMRVLAAPTQAQAIRLGVLPQVEVPVSRTESQGLIYQDHCQR